MPSRGVSAALAMALAAACGGGAVSRRDGGQEVEGSLPRDGDLDAAADGDRDSRADGRDAGGVQDAGRDATDSASDLDASDATWRPDASDASSRLDAPDGSPPGDGSCTGIDGRCAHDSGEDSGSDAGCPPGPSPWGLTPCLEADGVVHCVNLGTDDCNCGRCGRACECFDGICGDCGGNPDFQRCPPAVCLSGTELQCAYIRADRLNCGGCGWVCADGDDCVEGVCTPRADGGM